MKPRRLTRAEYDGRPRVPSRLQPPPRARGLARHSRPASRRARRARGGPRGYPPLGRPRSARPEPGSAHRQARVPSMWPEGRIGSSATRTGRTSGGRTARENVRIRALLWVAPDIIDCEAPGEWTSPGQPGTDEEHVCTGRIDKGAQPGTRTRTKSSAAGGCCMTSHSWRVLGPPAVEPGMSDVFTSRLVCRGCGMRGEHYVGDLDPERPEPLTCSSPQEAGCNASRARMGRSSTRASAAAGSNSPRSRPAVPKHVRSSSWPTCDRIVAPWRPRAIPGCPQLSRLSFRLRAALGGGVGWGKGGVPCGLPHPTRPRWKGFESLLGGVGGVPLLISSSVARFASESSDFGCPSSSDPALRPHPPHPNAASRFSPRSRAFAAPSRTPPEPHPTPPARRLQHSAGGPAWQSRVASSSPATASSSRSTRRNAARIGLGNQRLA